MEKVLSHSSKDSTLVEKTETSTISLGALVVGIAIILGIFLFTQLNSSGTSTNSPPNPAIGSLHGTLQFSDWVDSQGFIHAIDGNVYSPGKQWVWNKEKNDWVRYFGSGVPSDKALRISAQVFVYADESLKSNLISNYAGESGSQTEAVRNLALSLDQEPELLALIEAELNKSILDQAKSALMYPSKPSISCRSYELGSSVYTDCN